MNPTNRKQVNRTARLRRWRRQPVKYGGIAALILAAVVAVGILGVRSYRNSEPTVVAGSPLVTATPGSTTVPTSTPVAPSAVPVPTTTPTPSSAPGASTGANPTPVATPTPVVTPAPAPTAPAPTAVTAPPATTPPATAPPATVPTVTVPSVVGEAPGPAGAALYNAGLSGVRGTCTAGGGTTAPGVVVSQSPTAGAQVPRGTAVTYNVTIAPAPDDPTPCP